MSNKRSLRKVLKDWRETLNDVDGIKPNLQPFWQTQLGKGIRRLKSSDAKPGKQDESTTWYSGENTDNERYFNRFFFKSTI
jgi:hypothetical protein